MKAQRQIVAATLAGLCIVGVVGIAVRQARSQEDGFRLLSGALIGPKTAYIPLPTEIVSGRQVMEVSPSSDGHDALITALSLPPIEGVTDVLDPDSGGDPNRRLTRHMEKGGRMDMSVLLWSAKSRKPSTVWRGGGSLQTGMSVAINAQWFADSRIALMQIMTLRGPFTPEQMEKGEVKPTLSLLRINGATGKTQPLTANMEQESQLLMSPFNPVAVIVSGEGAVVQRISEKGAVGAAMTIDLPGRNEEDRVFWYGWLPDGKTLRGSFSTSAADAKSATKRVLLDTLTGIVTDDATPRGTRPAPAPVPEPLPFVVHQARETLTREGIKTTVYPLWLEGRDKETTGRTLIAADSDPDKKPVVLQTAILYQHKGAVYAIPLLKSNAPEFLAQRRLAQRTETMQRAKQIGLAALMYAQDYDENFPPVGGAFGKAVDPFIKNGDVFNNPATGQSGFTPAYKMTSLAALANPAMTAFGYLDGPNGRAVIYADGHVTWEETPAKP